MSTLVKAVYKDGVFEPTETIEGLMENQEVQLQVWPVIPEEVVPVVEEGFWSDPEGEAEWVALSPWEQQGLRIPVLTPEEVEARVQWVHANWASIRLSSAQALEIATAGWLLEENLNL